MNLVGRWLSDFLRLGIGLAAALVAMQVPALTGSYAAALIQVAEESRRDIEGRKDVARGYYRLEDRSDSGVVAALRQREPSNAQGLEASIAREGVLRAAHARIAAAPALLRPIEAALDVSDDPYGSKRAVLNTAIGLHEPQILLGLAAATYALAGLLLGLLAANLLVGLLSLIGGRRHRAA